MGAIKRAAFQERWELDESCGQGPLKRRVSFFFQRAHSNGALLGSGLPNQRRKIGLRASSLQAPIRASAMSHKIWPGHKLGPSVRAFYVVGFRPGGNV
ncbi:hypothetical protein NL676_037822 [Syzygium grande]|nr:hypothetical protein NL676_037822 [Syzygium grande]